MKVETTTLPGVLMIEPTVFRDERGAFVETWQDLRYGDHGVPTSFVQDNVSMSRRGVIRGLHFQEPGGQGKLVSVIAGEVFDVAVDVRLGSPTFGQWWGCRLDGVTRRQLYIPPGFAHGFCVLSEEAHFFYKCTTRYEPSCEATLAFDDPDLGIPWPSPEPIVSPKDRRGLRLKDFPNARLPQFASARAS